MAGYQWVHDSFDYAGSGSIQSLPTIPLAIPAHCTIRKLVVRNTYLNGHLSATQSAGLGQLFIQQVIQFTSGPYGTRVLRNTQRGCPATAVAVNTAGSLTNYYDIYFWGGDDQFGINEKCSYGSPTAAAMGIELTSLLANEGYPGQLAVNPGVRFTSTFAVLFYQH